MVAASSPSTRSRTVGSWSTTPPTLPHRRGGDGPNGRGPAEAQTTDRTALMVPRDGRPRQPARFQPRLAGRQVAQAAAAGPARSRVSPGAYRLRLPTRRTYLTYACHAPAVFGGSAVAPDTTPHPSGWPSARRARAQVQSRPPHSYLHRLEPHGERSRGGPGSGIGKGRLGADPSPPPQRRADGRGPRLMNRLKSAPSHRQDELGTVLPPEHEQGETPCTHAAPSPRPLPPPP